MSRRVHIVVGTVAAVFVAILGTIGMVVKNCSFSHECQIEFGYQDGVPSAAVVTHDKNVRDAISTSIQNRYRGLLFEFADKQYYPLPFEKMVRRCLSAPELLGENESRARAVLSSMRLEVTGIPCTNYLYQCRLVLSDSEKRNLDEYARICLAMVKERITEDNRVCADRAVADDNQQMRKAERRIDELEKSIAQGNPDKTIETEIRQARSSVKEMKCRIDEIRRHVMDTNAKRITDESPPEVSWIVRHKKWRLQGQTWLPE